MVASWDIWNPPLWFNPYNEPLTNFPTVDFSLKSDLFWAHVNTGAANSLSLFRASILYDHKWPCNGFWFIGNRPEHVLYAISQSEAHRVLRGAGWGREVTFWACHINGRGGNFLKYPLPGRGKFFIWLNCLKITDPCLGINNEQSLTCGRWRQGVLCVIQSLPHPDFRCATRFPEWFCVRPSSLFSPSRLPHLKSPLPYPLRKAWYSGYFCTP